MLPLVLLLALALPPLGSGPAAGQDDARLGLETIRDDERSVLDQLNQIDRELQEVRDRKDAFEGQLAEIQERARRHEDDAAVAEARLAARRPEVKARVRALYRLHRRGLARIVFGAEDPAELRRRSVYLRRILHADLERLVSYASAIGERAQARSSLDADLQEMRNLRAELQLQEAQLVEQRARRLSVLGDIRSRRAVYMGVLDDYRGVQQRMESDLALSSRAAAAESPSDGSFREAFGRLPWPANGRLIRRFGRYTDAVTGEEMDSPGIEIAAEFGSPFRAVFDGTVKVAEFVPGYGQTVAVEHGAYQTIYSHANGVRVRRGDRVRAGDVLGMVGNSGLTDGSGYVLGFEVRYHGTPQDPLPWLSPR